MTEKEVREICLTPGFRRCKNECEDAEVLCPLENPRAGDIFVVKIVENLP
jgi:hypothetical protein